jgi:type I restriction enzyme, S subunit
MITLQERVHGSRPPSSWSLGKLSQTLRVRKGHKNTGMQEENLLSLSYGRIIDKDINSAEGLLPESFETYQIVEPGNIVMRLTDLQNDKRSLRQGLVKRRGIVTSAYDALEVARGHDPRFWAYALLALDLAKYYYSLGGGVRQSIKFDDFPNEWLAAPDLNIQSAIADFLDRETARTDQLIEKKQRLVALLSERYDASASDIVRGTNHSQNLMRDSGIDWLGAIPSAWPISRIGWLVQRITYGF